MACLKLPTALALHAILHRLDVAGLAFPLVRLHWFRPEGPVDRGGFEAASKGG